MWAAHTYHAEKEDNVPVSIPTDQDYEDACVSLLRHYNNHGGVLTEDEAYAYAYTLHWFCDPGRVTKYGTVVHEYAARLYKDGNDA